MLNSNIKEVIKALEEKKLVVANPALYSDALIAALNTGMGLMKQRIFNDGEDSDNIPFGKYTSLQYEELREKKGRQIVKKDLELTGSLRLSIEIVEFENKVIIKITNAENADIAEYQEQQIADIKGQTEPIKIFVLSNDEYEAVKVQAERNLKQILDAI